MDNPTGRHRRPRGTLAGRLWQLAIAALAVALAYVFVPPAPSRLAIEPAPERPQLRPASPGRVPHQAAPGFPPEQVWATSAVGASSRWESSYHASEPAIQGMEPDEPAGALVRPYMPPPPQGCVAIPRPRIPEGDLLACPSPSEQGEFDDLAHVIRAYLAMTN